MIEGEIADAAEEPGAGTFDFLPVGVEPEEGILDDVLGSLAVACESMSETEERRFLGIEYLAESGLFLHGSGFMGRGNYRDGSGGVPN